MRKKQIRNGKEIKWKWISNDKKVTRNSTKTEKFVPPEDPAEEEDPPDLSQITSKNKELIEEEDRRCRGKAEEFGMSSNIDCIFEDGETCLMPSISKISICYFN